MIEENKDKSKPDISHEVEGFENPINQAEELDNDDLTYDYSAFEARNEVQETSYKQDSKASNEQANNQATSIQENMKNMSVLLKSDDASIIIIICSALVVVISSFTGNGQIDEADGITPSGFIVGILFGILILILASVKYYASKNENTLDASQSLMLTAVISGLWSILTFWLTNDLHYFGATSNGYFALWVGALTSYKLLLTSTGIFEPLLGQFKLVGWQLALLMLSSGMLVTASTISYLADTASNKDVQVMIGMVVGATSAGVSIGTFFGISRLSQKLRIGIFGILAVLWVIATIVLTTAGAIFSITGNGYFASWGGLISSLLLLSQVLNFNTNTGILQSTTTSTNDQNYV